MSGFILACWRHESAALPTAAVRRCADRLRPRDVSARDALIQSRDRLILHVFDPVPGLPTVDGAACLGTLLDAPSDWGAAGSPPPDGAYALVRHDEERVELVSDALASRTMWYVLTPDRFLASTSQRALVALLGGYEPDDEAFTWFMASGTLGPDAGWDRRLRRVDGWTTVTLDRTTWRIRHETRPVEFVAAARSDTSLVADLRDAVLASCAGMDIDMERWLLPLSGGMDSRALLLGFLAAGRRPACVTWGLRASLGEPGNDAFVADQLARTLQVRHRYIAIDHAGEPVRGALTRFLTAGEGRSEDFGGYTDGLALWRRLRRGGVSGVIRGDEAGWGYGHYHSEGYARRRVHLVVLADYAPGHLVRRLGLDEPPVPERLAVRSEETLTTYRDRIYEAFNLPVFFAALNDVKTPFVEITNPFLTRAVVTATRALPDRLRHGRRAFADVVGGLSPPVPYARREATADPDEYLGRPAMLDELAAELRSADAEQVLPRPALDEVVAALQRPTKTDVSRRLQLAVRRVVPHAVGRRLRPDSPVLLTSRQLAFRIYIVSRMRAILREDAAALTSAKEG